jgi:hypothetical protein
MVSIQDIRSQLTGLTRFGPGLVGVFGTFMFMYYIDCANNFAQSVEPVGSAKALLESSFDTPLNHAFILLEEARNKLIY